MHYFTSACHYYYVQMFTEQCFASFGFNYCSQSSSLSFEKKIFLLEMVENDIRLGGTSLAHLEDLQTCLLLYLFI